MLQRVPLRRGRVRVRVNLSNDVLAKYGGGFIRLLRPDLYERMLAAAGSARALSAA